MITLNKAEYEFLNTTQNPKRSASYQGFWVCRETEGLSLVVTDGNCISVIGAGEPRIPVMEVAGFVAFSFKDFLKEAKASSSEFKYDKAFSVGIYPSQNEIAVTVVRDGFPLLHKTLPLEKRPLEEVGLSVLNHSRHENEYGRYIISPDAVSIFALLGDLAAASKLPVELGTVEVGGIKLAAASVKTSSGFATTLTVCNG